MQKICCVHHPQHRAAAAAQFVLFLDHVALDVDAAHDRAARVFQRVNEPHAPVHTITTQFRLALAFERLAYLDEPSVAVTKPFVFTNEMPC
jgi:hypothetical protein